MHQHFAEIHRGDFRESIHRGSLAVTDEKGRLIASAGDPEFYTYWRSAAKPVQLLPLIVSGAADHYQFSDEELAVMMASHSGQPRHRAKVRSILSRIGLSAEDLNCGVHPPIHSETRKDLYRGDGAPDVLHNNCSGKHAGMLAMCVYRGWPVEGYDKKGHPLQKLLYNYVVEMTGFDTARINTGSDGCGVVVYHLPLRAMARAYARLAVPSGLPEDIQQACSRIGRIMKENPGLLAGEGRFNTDLLADFPGESLLAKSGAEGIFCLGHEEEGFGLALKIADGNSRSIPPLVLTGLGELLEIDLADREGLSEYIKPDITNHREEKVGHIEADISLKYNREEKIHAGN